MFVCSICCSQICCLNYLMSIYTLNDIVIGRQYLISLAKPSWNWFCKTGFSFMQWMDDFTESKLKPYQAYQNTLQDTCEAIRQHAITLYGTTPTEWLITHISAVSLVCLAVVYQPWLYVHLTVIWFHQLCICCPSTTADFRVTAITVA